jgi:hypothetical protein
MKIYVQKNIRECTSFRHSTIVVKLPIPSVLVALTSQPLPEDDSLSMFIRAVVFSNPPPVTILSELQGARVSQLQ